MKDRIDDLPFSQDWPDRATSSTLQRGFNPGEPRNNHLPAIHPFASRSLLLLESSAVWSGINVCRSPFLGFPSCQYLLTSTVFLPIASHIRRRLNNTGILINNYSDITRSLSITASERRRIVFDLTYFYKVLDRYTCYPKHLGRINANASVNTTTVRFSFRIYRRYHQIVKLIRQRRKLLWRLYVFFQAKRTESSPKRIRRLDNYYISINFVLCDISLVYKRGVNSCMIEQIK